MYKIRSDNILRHQCLDTCAEGKYGLNCESNCTCENGATCSPVNGSCICAPGWKGELCNERACPDGSYGPGCSKVRINIEIQKENRPFSGYITPDIFKGLSMRREKNCTLSSLDRDMHLPRWLGRWKLRTYLSRLLLRWKLQAKMWLQEQRAMFSHQWNLHMCRWLQRQRLQRSVPEGNLRWGLRSEMYLQKRRYMFPRKWPMQLHSRYVTYNSEAFSLLPFCSFLVPFNFVLPLHGDSLSGWNGFLCDRPCPENSYGKDCTETCKCLNKAACNPQNGKDQNLVARCILYPFTFVHLVISRRLFISKPFAASPLCMYCLRM